ncbi:hypothetical protein RRG08_030974 [Elysia crispata]|nr:hypothetical protein RRG08_030974 [Elysia crispata]
MTTPTATARISSKKQTLEDAYSPPANFLEIDVSDPQTHGVAKKRYTDYEVRMKTNLPVFKLKESGVRRRYSDFEWLRNELERDSKIVVPPLPGKAFKRQLPFRGDDGIFEDEFIEDRRKGLEQFVNKVAGHPLAQNEKCLHMFLQEPVIDKNYVPGKIRTTLADASKPAVPATLRRHSSSSVSCNKLSERMHQHMLPSTPSSPFSAMLCTTPRSAPTGRELKTAGEKWNP